MSLFIRRLSTLSKGISNGSLTTRASLPQSSLLASAAHARTLSTATSPDSKPLQLYTWGTPNGHKVSVFLEELKAVYGINYELSVPSYPFESKGCRLSPTSPKSLDYGLLGDLARGGGRWTF